MTFNLSKASTGRRFHAAVMLDSLSPGNRYGANRLSESVWMNLRNLFKLHKPQAAACSHDESSSLSPNTEPKRTLVMPLPRKPQAPCCFSTHFIISSKIFTVTPKPVPDEAQDAVPCRTKWSWQVRDGMPLLYTPQPEARIFNESLYRYRVS